jgi:hypothetical protein
MQNLYQNVEQALAVFFSTKYSVNSGKWNEANSEWRKKYQKPERIENGMKLIPDA